MRVSLAKTENLCQLPKACVIPVCGCSPANMPGYDTPLDPEASHSVALNFTVSAPKLFADVLAVNANAVLCRSSRPA
jgi:hypothetical protein